MDQPNEAGRRQIECRRHAGNGCLPSLAANPAGGYGHRAKLEGSACILATRECSGCRSSMGSERDKMPTPRRRQIGVSSSVPTLLPRGKQRNGGPSDRVVICFSPLQWPGGICHEKIVTGCCVFLVD